MKPIKRRGGNQYTPRVPCIHDLPDDDSILVKVQFSYLSIAGQTIDAASWKMLYGPVLSGSDWSKNNCCLRIPSDSMPIKAVRYQYILYSRSGVCRLVQPVHKLPYPYVHNALVAVWVFLCLALLFLN